MNQVYLQARVVEIQAIRHTPAGLPVLDLVLEHSADVIEAAHQRRVEFTIIARALGPQATQLQAIALGTELRVEGFLAPTRKSSTKLVLHIQAASLPSPQTGSNPNTSYMV